MRSPSRREFNGFWVALSWLVTESDASALNAATGTARTVKFRDGTVVPVGSGLLASRGRTGIRQLKKKRRCYWAVSGFCCGTPNQRPGALSDKLKGAMGSVVERQRFFSPMPWPRFISSARVTDFCGALTVNRSKAGGFASSLWHCEGPPRAPKLSRNSRSGATTWRMNGLSSRSSFAP